ncbi:hypothetical protein OAB94_02530 [Flavobacteriaceae bacterium]|nr:hypothetical protein [Flavobacteriaceae bacterium]
MKPKKEILPAPRGNCWKDIVKKYEIDDIVEYNGVFQIVTLPPGWFIKKNNLYKNHLDIYNEDCKVVGMTWMTNTIGFTILDESKL